MASHLKIFLIFIRYKSTDPSISFAPRPGLALPDDTFDLPYRFKTPEPKEIPIFEEELPEYHHTNMNFWWFIFGAIIISFFLFATEFSHFGVTSEWYKNLKLFPGSPDPVGLMLGNAFLALLLAWTAYHMFKYHNPKIIRYGAVFFMVGIYVLLLMWALALFSSREPRTSLLFLLVIFVMLGGWILLSWYNHPGKELDNNHINITLGLAFIWVFYLLYYNLGILKNNNVKLFGDLTIP